MPRAGIALTAAALLLSGCEVRSTGETRHETVAIERDSAATVHVDIRMGSGELTVQGGTPKLLQAAFDYNVAAWKPAVDYHSSSGRGELSIAEPNDSGTALGNTVYAWNLKLNTDVPLEVSSALGAGQATMELGSMNLRGVEVNIGAGELTLDLRGEPKKDYSVQVHGGVGQAIVYLPRTAGISASAAGGLGQISTSGLEMRNGVWVNPDAIDAAVTVRLDVKGGVGEIRLIR